MKSFVVLLVVQSLSGWTSGRAQQPPSSAAPSHERGPAQNGQLLWDPVYQLNQGVRPRRDRLPPGFEVRRVLPAEDNRRKLSPPTLQDYPPIAKLLESTSRIPLSEYSVPGTIAECSVCCVVYP